jgi:hypothetical protein
VAEAAPGPAAKADAARVLVDVLDRRDVVLLILDDAAREAAAEEVAGAVVAAVEPHRVDAVQPSHVGRKLRLRGVDEQVEVVVEQVPRADVPAVPLLDLAEQLEPRLAILVVLHDRPLLDPAADHVVPRRARQQSSR